MDLAATLTFGGASTMVAILFLLGAAPVFTVRIIGLLYPKGSARRAELLAEMEHVRQVSKVPQQWLWLGENFALGVCDGIPRRLRLLEARIRAWFAPPGAVYFMVDTTAAAIARDEATGTYRLDGLKTFELHKETPRRWRRPKVSPVSDSAEAERIFKFMRERSESKD